MTLQDIVPSLGLPSQAAAPSFDAESTLLACKAWQREIGSARLVITGPGIDSRFAETVYPTSVWLEIGSAVDMAIALNAGFPARRMIGRLRSDMCPGLLAVMCTAGITSFTVDPADGPPLPSPRTMDETLMRISAGVVGGAVVPRLRYHGVALVAPTALRGRRAATMVRNAIAMLSCPRTAVVLEARELGATPAKGVALFHPLQDSPMNSGRPAQ